MGWGIGCSGMNTKAGQAIPAAGCLATMSIYVVLVRWSRRALMKHGHLQGWMALCFWRPGAGGPGDPDAGADMGVYLREETDEYVRAMTVRVSADGRQTGALMGTIVVSDFLRAFAQGRERCLRLQLCFLVFFLGFGTAQVVQMMQRRVGGDD